MVDPLPSYGHGRDTAGGRYISLLFGTNLTDVIVTGKFAIQFSFSSFQFFSFLLFQKRKV